MQDGIPKDDSPDPSWECKEKTVMRNGARQEEEGNEPNPLIPTLTVMLVV